MKKCVLNDAKICDDCGECNRCDLDPNKICDNCCKCLETENEDGFRKINLTDFNRHDKIDELFTDPFSGIAADDDAEEDAEDDEVLDDLAQEEIPTAEDAALFREWEEKLADMTDFDDPAMHLHYCNLQSKGKRK